jgi:hypothetical protein
VTTSAINSALTTSATLMNKLASVNAARASSQTNNELNLIQTQITNQTNQKIAALQDQVDTSSVTPLQAQQKTLNTQLKSYQTTEGQLSSNNSLLADLSLQLGTLATAAQAGDAATFDATLASAQNDVSELQSVTYVPGLLQDGTAALQSSGLSIQSSSTYNLGTAAGQAQALSDVQAAEAQVQQISTLSGVNQSIVGSAQTALQTQISNVTAQINNLQLAQQTYISQQTAILQQDATEEFHIIEMNLGNASKSASIITSSENYLNIASATPGTTLGLLAGTTGQPSLAVANLTTSSSSASHASSSSSSRSSSGSSSGGTSNSQPGSLFSTTA